MENLFDLSGKEAVVTGTSRGLGQYFGRALARAGADLVITSRDKSRLVEFRQEIKALGRRALPVRLDVLKEDDIEDMVRVAVEEYGKIDILVNNAGGDWATRDYTDIPLDHWKAVLSAEIDGAFLTMKYVVPGMRKRQWGRVVHIGMSAVFGMENTAGLAPDYLGFMRWMRAIPRMTRATPSACHRVARRQAIGYSA